MLIVPDTTDQSLSYLDDTWLESRVGLWHMTSAAQQPPVVRLRPASQAQGRLQVGEYILRADG